MIVDNLYSPTGLPVKKTDGVNRQFCGLWNVQYALASCPWCYCPGVSRHFRCMSGWVKCTTPPVVVGTSGTGDGSHRSSCSVCVARGCPKNRVPKIEPENLRRRRLAVERQEHTAVLCRFVDARELLVVKYAVFRVGRHSPRVDFSSHYAGLSCLPDLERGCFRDNLYRHERLGVSRDGRILSGPMPTGARFPRQSRSRRDGGTPTTI